MEHLAGKKQAHFLREDDSAYPSGSIDQRRNAAPYPGVWTRRDHPCNFMIVFLISISSLECISFYM
ncbi:hypothetical protein HU200_060575 [Digitaria exilis]|uniref:Uncharacterized protein n=1 Tax=Digitaria exilis TaxID=1010633 RepID=A0A835AAI3_9POAL|nr:hypothetical protein HU200_060575 [Digitaria exilis]